jgi:hypothetical protein
VTAVPNLHYAARSLGLVADIPYRCPTTGQTVQGFVAEEARGDTYESIGWLACRRLHSVNPATGKVLGEDDDE